MAEAPESSGGGGGIDAGLVVIVLIILLILWLRNSGWEKLRENPINFGWQSATTTNAFPFAPNVGALAPRVYTPGISGPAGPRGPSGPKP